MNAPERRPEPVCPRCGAPYEPDQEYCLDCGYRLGPRTGVVGNLSRRWTERFGWYPGDWIWRVLLGLVIAIIGGAVAIAVAASGGGGHPLVATGPGTAHVPTSPPPTATVSLPTVPKGTPTATTTTTPTPSTTAPPAPGALVAWPANRSGFTVVLESIPTSAGHSLAVARARAASRAGLRQVGVLDSSRYSSLHPGYFVVFSGIYSTRSSADAAAAVAGRRGFDAAYARQITR